MVLNIFFFECSADHRNLHVLTHSFPTRRSSDLARAQMINLNVNGVDRQFDGDPEMPLLWYLRDELGLGGTKYGCGTGLCGACTVHLDGSAVRSCLTAVSEAADAAVTTIEEIGRAHV